MMLLGASAIKTNNKHKSGYSMSVLPFFSAQEWRAFARVADIKLNRTSVGMTAILLVIVTEEAVTVEWDEKHHRASHTIENKIFLNPRGLTVSAGRTVEVYKNHRMPHMLLELDNEPFLSNILQDVSCGSVRP
uniref:Uncharacterized protein n=1 Tax=Rhipicephalus appendiculatus TaxID=34631 RepID=A0A131YDB6_RHIAP